MRIHDASFAMVSSTNANTGKTSGQNSSNSKYDMMIERIQGQIQNVNVKIQIVNEDKSLSPDEKKEKIKKLNEKLEEHQVELGRAKAAQSSEAVMEQSKEVKNSPADNSSITKVINNDGDILELSKTALLQADNILENQKLAEVENTNVRVGDENNASILHALSASNEKG